MTKKTVLAGILIVAAILIGFSSIAYWNNLDYSNKTKHETERWAVITDSKNDIIAVETADLDIWGVLWRICVRTKLKCG